jgi:predicted amidohydrolase YtcJ
MSYSRRIAAASALVVVLALVAGCSGASRPAEPNSPADLVVINGRVYPGGGAAFAQAVAVSGNQVVLVGTTEQVKALAGAKTTVVDARGAAVMPGFDDSHLHVISGGLTLQQALLGDATSIETLKTVIREFAAAHPDKPWVLGRGWTYTAVPGGLPNRQQLDEVVPDRPALMTCFDGHTTWVNTKALQLAGITKATRSPEGGEIVKDPKTGEPTGVFKEHAQGLVRKLVPAWTEGDQLDAVRAAVKTAHAFGVTSVQNAGDSAVEMALFDRLRRSGELRLRIYSAMDIDPGLTEAAADKLDQLWKQYGDDPILKTGAVKMFIDGVIDSHTAVMLKPYTNKPINGTPLWKAAEFQRVITMLDKRGWQVWVHAIGDGGVRMTLDAYEHAAAVNPAPARGRRHRIEHAETVDAADIPRFAKLNVIASQQPYHGTPDLLGSWLPNIGPERASRGWAYGSIRAAGGHIAFGSDWGVVSMDPRIGIHTALNRTSLDGRPAGGWLPEQKLPLTAVIDAYTSGAAYASFDEGRKGTLAPGMLADIVVMSTDIFANPPERLLDAKVETTIFDGKVVYSAHGGPRMP